MTYIILITDLAIQQYSHNQPHFNFVLNTFAELAICKLVLIFRIPTFICSIPELRKFQLCMAHPEVSGPAIDSVITVNQCSR